MYSNRYLMFSSLGHLFWKNIDQILDFWTFFLKCVENRKKPVSGDNAGVSGAAFLVAGQT